MALITSGRFQTSVSSRPSTTAHSSSRTCCPVPPHCLSVAFHRLSTAFRWTFPWLFYWLPLPFRGLPLPFHGLSLDVSLIPTAFRRGRRRAALLRQGPVQAAAGHLHLRLQRPALQGAPPGRLRRGRCAAVRWVDSRPWAEVGAGAHDSKAEGGPGTAT